MTTTRIVLVTRFDPSFVATTAFDWLAYDHITFPRSPVGWGSTESAAMSDFWAQWQMRYGYVGTTQGCELDGMEARNDN